MQTTPSVKAFASSVVADEVGRKRLERVLEEAVAAANAVIRRHGGGAAFEVFERTTLDVLNAIGRGVLEGELQRIADAQPERVEIEGWQHRRHMPGTVTYHSLCGPLAVRRFTYRPCNERNGVTIVPLDVEAKLVAHATPALAFGVLQAYAKAPLRSYEEDMHAAFRTVPSRSTMERMALSLAGDLQDHVPHIEPEVRAKEKVPPETHAISLGLDRTTVPMEELRTDGEAPNTRRKKRRKPYVRKPRPPAKVEYRMAYVATIAALDRDGNSLVTRRYAAPAEQGPRQLLERLMADLSHLVKQRGSLPIVVVQDGAPEMWNLMRGALAAAGFGHRQWREIIDRYHVNERLARVAEIVEHDETRRRTLFAKWNADLDRSDGALLRVIATLDPRVECASRSKQTELDQHCAYLWEVAESGRCRYASFRRRCLPIGSGVTEGACKSLISLRAKRSGQRWHHDGINAVLTIRSLHQSERLLAVWNRYQDQLPAQVRAAL